MRNVVLPFISLALAAASVSAAAQPAAIPAAGQPCVLEYQRADNMWAAEGRPDGNLGKERITLQPGQKIDFDTDWKHEKQRNDGRHYYGSHTRVVSNAGAGPLYLSLRSASSGGGTSSMIGNVGNVMNAAINGLQRGQSRQIKADLVSASCGVPNGAIAGPTAGRPCTLEYQRADNMWAAAGRPDGNLGRETVALKHGESRIFDTDWKHEKQRNDGAHYYGSHTRIVANTGGGTIFLRFRSLDPGTVVATGSSSGLSAIDVVIPAGHVSRLEPGAGWRLKADLLGVGCGTADDLGQKLRAVLGNSFR
jgi:hypothetical protein